MRLTRARDDIDSNQMKMLHIARRSYRDVRSEASTKQKYNTGILWHFLLQNHEKYKESTHMPPIDHPISQPSLDISPIWTLIIAAEVRKLQLRPV
jgi:hypothetical protein